MLAFLPLLAFAAPPDYAALERAIVDEVNQLRADPRAYAAHLDAQRRLYRGKVLHLPREKPILTREGVDALLEVARALRSTQPVAVLARAAGLSSSARDLVREQGPKGFVGHESASGGPDERASRYAREPVSIAENVAYGPKQARAVVVDLLIDDGVPNRGHRTNLLRPELRYIGVACGPHAIYGTMCAIDMAIEFQDR